MADDRYSWLDENVAERLLRGESADALAAIAAENETGRELARSVAEVLANAGSVPMRPGGARDAGELPGEAAALAAFRKARTSAAATSATASTPVGGPAVAHTLPTVRLTQETWSSKLSRPLRAGLAAALAACALGGVAVAAGTGVLPTPFGGGPGNRPAPASSVSVAGTPEPEQTGREMIEGSQEPSRGTGRTDEAPRPPKVGRPEGATPSPGGPPDTGDGGGAQSQFPFPDTDDKLGMARDFCQKYEDGSLDDKMREWLEHAAGGSQALGRYCDQLLHDAQSDNGSWDPGHANGGDQSNADGGNQGSGGAQGDQDGDSGEATGGPGGPGGQSGDGGAGGTQGQSSMAPLLGARSPLGALL